MKPRIASLSALVLATCLLPFTAARADAQPNSPLGLWKTIDDKTGAPRAIVRIYEKDGKLFGKIVSNLTPGGAPNPVCSVCKDERKNQPIQGLVMIRNMKADGGEYSGEDLLDPDNGSVYRCKMHVEGGTRLVVRGYLGISLLGRTQTWERQTDSDLSSR
jgi:uncharacterized protein (DUF2147 family)